MPSKAQLAAEIMENSALKNPVAREEDAAYYAQKTRRLERMAKPDLVALHARTLTVTEDAQALADLVAEALQDQDVIISVSSGTVRVEQANTPDFATRVAGHDATKAALRAQGFDDYCSGGCVIFIDL